MKNKISYSKNPKDIAYAIKSSLVINDFLPPQDKLIIKGDTSKVKKKISAFLTISLKNLAFHINP
ncbi:hypothetical protein LPTSP3_g31330 [Leptospira kobayashii]|uniref:Uncharacterized protein n=1 Tax=Leptospira kobayashii TaxID=1917830 RepID=A0ABN6KG71_9LEPT|nr:hypothetical protein [Leptospira kobayashii]BDA80203.1 hypothetical protein LPTSP3_g31330 [Leptospira kobayashii]